MTADLATTRLPMDVAPGDDPSADDGDDPDLPRSQHRRRATPLDDRHARESTYTSTHQLASSICKYACAMGTLDRYIYNWRGALTDIWSATDMEMQQCLTPLCRGQTFQQYMQLVEESKTLLLAAADSENPFYRLRLCDADDPYTKTPGALTRALPKATVVTTDDGMTATKVAKMIAEGNVIRPDTVHAETATTIGGYRHLLFNDWTWPSGADVEICADTGSGKPSVDRAWVNKHFLNRRVYMPAESDSSNGVNGRPFTRTERTVWTYLVLGIR
ncbi:hypothetical protein N0V93_010314 [Gnomoniopsis smithogilvyi]|uniref:Uncharacterized protein n=1 Tax=Gnomoniopsis smithogilvyi TaxID=1191159 RepID=A0A9W8YHQ8_9PEZI|nr:hypothetical protein N0V93_010314 [Gnomoniopsis smithogilvyi]